MCKIWALHRNNSADQACLVCMDQSDRCFRDSIRGRLQVIMAKLSIDTMVSKF